jgi:hypothetical protein
VPRDRGFAEACLAARADADAAGGAGELEPEVHGVITRDTWAAKLGVAGL